MPLDLLVPDLLLPASAGACLAALRLPALEGWLARADLDAHPAAQPVAWLAAAYGLPAPPLAAISLAGEPNGVCPHFPIDGTGAWLRADPVHLRVEGDGLVLHDASSLAIGEEEARALVAALAALFAADGFEFHAPAPDRWYVRVPAHEVPRTVALDRAVGRDTFGLLPEGAGRINWRSLLTEAQMLLAAHEVNRAREDAGRPLVNSVWFWGEGAAPERLDRAYDSIHGNDPFARGLGTLSGAAVHGLPDSYETLAGSTRPGDRALVVLDALTAPRRAGDLDLWQASAEALERDWFRWLGEAVNVFGPVRLVLPRAADTRLATLNVSLARRWLRRPRPLDSHA